MSDNYKYHRPSKASLSLGAKISYSKLLCWILDFGISNWLPLAKKIPIGLIKEHVMYGAAEPAIVVQISPVFLVAAYSEDIDCVAIISPPVGFVKKYKLQVGDRLLTVNTYSDMSDTDNLSIDLIAGENRLFQEFDEYPNKKFMWNNFYPIIADFISDDLAAINQKKSMITEKEWCRATLLGTEYIEKFPNFYRHANPYISFLPARDRKHLL